MAGLSQKIDETSENREAELSSLERQVQEALAFKGAFISDLQKRLADKTSGLQSVNMLLHNQTQSLE